MKKVEIFIGPIAYSCAGGPSPAKQERIARAFALKGALEEDGRFEVCTWHLGDDEEYEEGIRLLRSYLEEAGEEDLAANLAFAINSVTPAVAVNGRLEYVSEAPMPEEFFEKVAGRESNRRMGG